MRRALLCTGTSERFAAKHVNMSQRGLLLSFQQTALCHAATWSSVRQAQREASCSHWRRTMSTTRQALPDQDVSYAGAVAAEAGVGWVRGAAQGLHRQDILAAPLPDSEKEAHNAPTCCWTKMFLSMLVGIPLAGTMLGHC